MANPNNKQTKVKTETPLDEKIRVAHQMLLAVVAFLMFVAVAVLITPPKKARVPFVPPTQRIVVGEPTRHLVAVAKGSDQVFLGWRLFSIDNPTIGFNVYRDTSPTGSFSYKVNNTGAINDSTNFIDTESKNDIPYYYIIKTVDSQGVEGPASNIAKVTNRSDNPGNPGIYQALSFNVTGGSEVGVGNLDTDEILDYVILDTNNVRVDKNKDLIPDYPGNTMWIRAYKNDGTSWSFNTNYYYRNWNIGGSDYAEFGDYPFSVWDIDGNGIAEVITRTDDPQEEDEDVNQTYLTIIWNGDKESTSQIALEYPTEIAQYLEKHPQDSQDPAHVNLPHYLSVAYLEGVNRTPQIVVQVAVHDGERLTAYNVDPETHTITKRWDFQSIEGYSGSKPNWQRRTDCTPDENPPCTGGSGYHGVMVYDMDQDGDDEVFDGVTLLEDDANGDEIPEIMWTAYSSNGTRLIHPDVVIPGNINGDGNLEVLFANEGRPNGIYLFSADKEEANLIWQYDYNGGHRDDGWVANLIEDADYPDYEMYVWEQEQDIEREAEIFKSSAPATRVWHDTCAVKRENYSQVMQWDEDETAEIFKHFVQGSSDDYVCDDILPTDKKIYKARKDANGNLELYDGQPLNVATGNSLRADILGDYSEELIYINDQKINVLTNTEEKSTRKVSRWENLEYRKDASRIGSSYWRYYNPIDFSQTAPDLNIEITDIDETVDEDEKLDLTLAITNNTSEFFSGEYWLYLEKHEEPPSGNPEVGPTSTDIDPFQTVTLPLSIELGDLDPGSYDAIAQAGSNYPVILDEDIANFFVLGGTAKAKTPINTNEPPPPEYEYIHFGASTASPLTSPLKLSPNGEFIGIQEGVLKDEPGDKCEESKVSCGGLAQYEFTIPEGKGGEYIIWGKVIAPNGSADSFWVRVDDGNVDNVPEAQDLLWDTLQMDHSSDWTWDRITHRGNQSSEDPQYNPVRFNLTPGTHTLKFSARDDGDALKHILITNDLTLEE